MTDLVCWELHAHTSPASRCGRLRARDMVRGVAQSGCFGVVITDHYDPERFYGAEKGKAYRDQLRDLFDGYRAAKLAGEEVGLKVLPAVELRIEGGNEDYLLYGANEDILADTGCLAQLNLQQVRRRLEPHGVLIVQAHPFRYGQRPAAPALLDGVEVLNGNPRHDSHNADAVNFARIHGLLMTRGSDIHQSEDFARTFMPLPRIENERELVKALRQYANEECLLRADSDTLIKSCKHEK